MMDCQDYYHEDDYDHQGFDYSSSSNETLPPAAPPSLLLDLALEAPELLVGVIGPFLDTQSWLRLTQCCSDLRGLEQEYEDHIWRHRLQRHYGFLRLLNNGGKPKIPPSVRRPQSTTRTTNNNPTWKSLGQSLYRGDGEYYGFCIDLFTENFEPYPMHLGICPEDTHTTSHIPHHTLHWRTLRDSKTRVRINDLCHGANGVWRWDFTEVEIIQGSDILVPNSYVAYSLGPALVGVFPIGSFFLLRQEAMTQERLEHTYLLEQHANNQNDNGGGGGISSQQQQQQGPRIMAPDVSGISPGLTWSGLVVCEIGPLDLTDLYRRPKPITSAMTLSLSHAKEVPRWDSTRKIMFAKRLSGTIKFESPTGGKTIVLSVVVGFCPDTSQNYMPSSYNVEILLQRGDGRTASSSQQRRQSFALPFGGELNPAEDDDPFGRESPYNNNNHLHGNPLAQFMQDCTMYAWLHNGQMDCMIGLMKDTLQNKTASFVLQQRQNDHFYMPDLNTPVSTDTC